jgi:Putative heavy-metal-binding
MQGQGLPPPQFEPSRRPPITPTSDLSVAEAAALRRVGLSPIGFVMGTAVMQLVSAISGNLYGGPFSAGGMGWGGMVGPWRQRGEYADSFPCAHGYGLGLNEHYGFNAENSPLAGSLLEGYRLALARLEAEAVALGAHGVVGVEIEFDHLVGSAWTATFFAKGTAVVHPGSAPLRAPFLTNASGQNFERLVGLGYIASGLAVGVGAVYVMPNCLARGDATVAGPNRQIPDAIGVARSRARQQLSATGHQRGEGVVHTIWTDRRAARYGEAWNQLTVAFGTAVRRYQKETPPLSPRPVVPLRP